MKTAQQTGGETLFEQLKKRKYGLIIPIYAMIYIPWFYYLERTVQNPTHIIHLAIDDYIPFIDVFIIPYMLWFGYISATVLWLLWKDKKEYLQLITFLIIGMTLFLVFSTLYPNGHQLRPASFDHNNIFTAMIARLYQTDSPNNILPSIHVYNSLGAWFAIQNSRLTRERPRLRMASLVMTSLIILSTMFIRQHSVLDVVLAFGLAGILYPVFYMPGCPVYYEKLLLSWRQAPRVKTSESRE